MQVVYAILRYKKAFARLANMTLVPPGDDESEVEASLGGPVQQQRASDKEGFVGTQAWFDEWKTKMPLGTVLRVIDRTFFLFFIFWLNLFWKKEMREVRGRGIVLVQH